MGEESKEKKKKKKKILSFFFLHQKNKLKKSKNIDVSDDNKTQNILLDNHRHVTGASGR